MLEVAGPARARARGRPVEHDDVSWRAAATVLACHVDACLSHIAKFCFVLLNKSSQRLPGWLTLKCTSEKGALVLSSHLATLGVRRPY
jgi:hypothetical protein